MSEESNGSRSSRRPLKRRRSPIERTSSGKGKEPFCQSAGERPFEQKTVRCILDSQPVVECHETRKLPSNTWPEADLLWRARCCHCQCLACSCTCVPSESLLFPRRKEPRTAHAACHHAIAINSRWRSTQEQINLHREVLIKFQHELEQATHGFTRCVICLDSFAVGDLLKLLPCNHCFHSVCISKWLAERSTCPVCQQCTNAKQTRTRAGSSRSRF